MNDERAESDHAIAAAWIDLHHADAGSQAREAHFWAYLALDDVRDSDTERFWQIINEIRRLDDSDVILSNVAAGPLEDLLVNAGAEFIDRIEAAALVDEGFRRMLGMVWKNAIPDAVWSRVEKASSRK